MFNSLFKKHKNNGKIVKQLVSGVAITAATLSGSAVAATSLTSSTADYSFTYDGKYKGTATRSLIKQTGNKWQYNVDAKASGIATAQQRATFVLNNNQVIPLTASMTYKVFGFGNTQDLAFDNNGKAITSKYKGKTKKFTSPVIAFDDLSLEAQIRQDLLSNRFSGNYYMAKKDKAEKTPFKKVGNAKITVPAGTFDTVRIDRVFDKAGRSTSFWLAPSLDYLTVKMQSNNDGKSTDIELTRVR